jgi:serine/threonine protein kinase
MMLEFCAGGAVDGIMVELGKPLTEQQIAYVTHGVCNALAFLHLNNTIHRDLKSGNILLTNDGIVKLGLHPSMVKVRFYLKLVQPTLECQQ